MTSNAENASIWWRHHSLSSTPKVKFSKTSDSHYYILGKNAVYHKTQAHGSHSVMFWFSMVPVSFANILQYYFIATKTVLYTTMTRHNGRCSVSNHQPHDCLLNRLFRRRSKKTTELRVTGLCAGNSPGTGEFPAQMASYAENVSIRWRHHKFTSSQHQIRPCKVILKNKGWYKSRTLWPKQNDSKRIF